MPGVLTLHRAGPQDLARIMALEQACFAAGDGAFSRRQLRRLLDNPNAFWLLTEDGQAMGCWLVVRNGRRRWARLYSLAVHPQQRGRGWARQLLEAGFHWMRQNGLSVCRAEVKSENQAARRLYVHMGFKEAGTLPNYYGPGLDGVRLCKTLATPAAAPSPNIVEARQGAGKRQKALERLLRRPVRLADYPSTR